MQNGCSLCTAIRPWISPRIDDGHVNKYVDCKTIHCTSPFHDFATATDQYNFAINVARYAKGIYHHAAQVSTTCLLNQAANQPTSQLESKSELSLSG